MASKYKVSIFLNAISYEVTAENEEEAVEKAEEFAMTESHYDLLKWADYEVEEVTNG